jgi:FkbH-like protein
LWPLIISAAGYFETVQFTSADLERAEQYADNAKRADLSSKSRDLKSYLTDLQMEMEVTSFVPGHRLRISQLINKSNQFNLTSRRYTDEQVQAMEADPACACFAARLKDRFGDNGIVSVVICKERNAFWHIDTWLMSCRVLARQVEQAFLNHIAESASQSGKRGLVGHYIPTSKNKMVESHYEKLGFASMKLEEDGSTTWFLDLANFKPFDVPIQIRQGAESDRVP